MEVIVSTEPLIGISRISNAWGRYYSNFFQDEDKVKILLVQLQSLGFKIFFCPNHPRLIKSFASISKTRDFEIYPILLNAAEYSRYIQNYGMVGFARRQLANKKIQNLLGISSFGIKYLPKILARDFKYTSLLLASIEMAGFKVFHPKAIFLHPQMTDLALANSNDKFFRLFASFIRKHKVEPGLMTSNIGVLLGKLEQWDIDIAHIAGPINRKGYHMKPDQHRCEELIMKTRRVIIATEVNSATIPTEDDIAYLGRLNVSSFVVELGNVSDAIKLIDLTAGSSESVY